MKISHTIESPIARGLDAEASSAQIHGEEAALCQACDFQDIVLESIGM
jgi:hypothetical protein